MKDDTLKNDLLSACLADIATPAFREGLLGEMLQRARYHRVRRQRNRALLSAAYVVAALVAIGFIPRKSNPRLLAEPNPIVVHSVPLAAAMMVATQPGKIGIVATSSANLEIIQGLATRKSFEPIGDSELFAMLGGRPAILIHHYDLEAELILVNPADRAGFAVR